MVLYQLGNIFWCSNLYHIQTTLLPLITQDFLQTCIPRDLTIPGLIIVSITGACKLNQGYSRSTMVGPVKDGQVWSLCLRHDNPAPRVCSPSKLQYTSTVLRLSRADFRQPAMCFKTDSCLQVIQVHCGYNEQEHRKVSVSQCSHRDGS
jgi:hypothetical protein